MGKVRTSMGQLEIGSWRDALLERAMVVFAKSSEQVGSVPSGSTRKTSLSVSCRGWCRKQRPIGPSLDNEV